MPVIKWSKQLELGIPSMDEQHQRWVALINGVHAALQEGQHGAVLEQGLAGMLEYTKTHFKDEERILRATRYLGYTAHKALHDDFTRQLEEFRAELEGARGGPPTAAIRRLIKLLAHWLRDHITAADREYVEHLRRKGVH